METKITQQDLIGDLNNFPIEIVEKMLECQNKQVGKKDISIFQKDRCEDAGGKGFSWSATIEGHYFWKNVIRDKNFDLFFERYPKVSKNVYIRGDRKNAEEVIKELESRGGINKWEYSGNAEGMLYFIDPVTNYISGAAETEEAFQNLLITVYTGISPCNTKVVELTMEEIAKKLGVDAEFLRIKK